MQSGAKRSDKNSVLSRVGDHGMDVKDQTRKESKPFLCFFRNKIKRICQINSQYLKSHKNTTNNFAKVMFLLFF